MAVPSAVPRPLYTLMLALYAGEIRPRLLRAAAGLIATIVAGVVIASVAGRGDTVEGISAIANGLMVAFAPPAVVIGVWRNLREALLGQIYLVTVVAVFVGRLVPRSKHPA